MAQRTYRDLQRAGWRYTLRVPGVLLPGRFGTALRAVWPRWGQPVGAGVVAGAHQAYPYPAMQAHMHPVADARPALVAGMQTDDAVFPFVEWGSQAGYWPRFGAGSPLAAWAARHNLSAFYAAAHIHAHGTPARKAMPGALRAQIPAFLTALRGAVSEAIRDA